jgi:hypothetical protein
MSLILEENNVMWIEAEDGTFVNLDYKRALAARDRPGDDGEVQAVQIIALDASELHPPDVLRAFTVSTHLPLREARAAADTYMQGIRQALADRGVFIRPARRSTVPGAVVTPAARKGEG